MGPFFRLASRVGPLALGRLVPASFRARLLKVLALSAIMVFSSGQAEANTSSGARAEAAPPAAGARPDGSQTGDRVASSFRPDDAPSLGTGRPKIPGPPREFTTHHGQWVRFAYPPAERPWVEPLIRNADQVRNELVSELGYPVLRQLEVHIARTRGEMMELVPEGTRVPSEAVGMAFSELRLVVLALSPARPNHHHDLLEVFRHEAAHVALHEAVANHYLPRWFDEGFAIHASGESSLLRLRELSTATLAGRLIPLEQLAAGFPADPVRVGLAYAQAADVVRFLMRQQDRARFISFVGRLRAGQPFDSALEDAYGSGLAGLELEWQKDVAKRYSFWPVLMASSVVWIGVVGLMVWGWRRRKLRDRATLDRWAQEEALEDARQGSEPVRTPLRIHVVLARPGTLPPAPAPVLPELEVPKVEHDGQWHTLH